MGLREELNDSGKSFLISAPTDKERGVLITREKKAKPSENDFSLIHRRTEVTGQTITSNPERQMDTQNNSQDQKLLELLTGRNMQVAILMNFWILNVNLV